MASLMEAYWLALFLFLCTAGTKKRDDLFSPYKDRTSLKVTQQFLYCVLIVSMVLSAEEAHQAGMGLLIHCQAGVSRSATIVIAYLMKHTWMTMTDAYKFVKTRRPIISPNLNFMGQLLEFEEDLNNGITPRILTPKLIGVETIV